ncbi:MAG TPA: hypothetical protein VM735_11000 [Candidatus Kapabacteria bacterium]|jgi:hypothetical protein|nr:hypothetical protein [Candidatus Kapabacteria bacterium]
MNNRVVQLALQEIDSDADYVVFSEKDGVLSEHYTAGEARMSYFKEASGSSLGAQLPRIYQREETHWVPLS